MKSASLAFMAILTLSSASWAQQSGYVGMRHLKPKPAPAAPVEQSVEDEIKPAEDETPALPVYKALSPKDALIKPEDLETWGHINDAALATTKTDLEKLVHTIEMDRGAVPPQGLFFAAKSLFDAGLKEQAAIYYFVGQLRLSFDMARWPSTPNKDDVARREMESKKSPDQVSPNSNKAPRLDNPHKGSKNLASHIGEPIISWALKDTARMDKIFKAVKEWDERAPYASLPNYDLTEPAPFEKWDKLLAKSRSAYFTQMMSWSKMMAKVRR